MPPRTLIPLCLALLACDSGAASTPTPPLPSRFGIVRAAVTTQTIVGRTFSQSHANAAFLDTADASGGRSCDRRGAGACVLYRCASAAGSAQLPNAGPITITGGDAGAVVLSVRGDGGYDTFSHSSAAVWRPGQAVTVSAPGVAGLVPAFSAQVSMPGEGFGLVQPQISPVLSVDIDRAADLQVAYTGAAGPVQLLLVQDLTSGEGAYLLCSFPAGQGGGVVPASLLGALAPTQGSTHTGLLLVGPAAGTAVAAGGWSIDVAAVGVGNTAVATLR